MTTMHTISYQVEIKPASVWQTVPAGAITAVSGEQASGGNEANPFAFGETPAASHTITGYYNVLKAYAWPRRPVRTTVTVDGTPQGIFTGIVVGCHERISASEASTEWSCETWLSEIAVRAKDLYSLPFVRRAIATATTAGSVEDPANPSYAAGPINWALWQCGGRPWEQSGSYTTADFYYSCDQALAAPDVSWFAAEDGLQAMQEMAAASGGQIYQDSQGVVRYRNLVSVGASGSVAATFSDRLSAATDVLHVYADSARDTRTDQYATKFTCPYTPRELRPVQQVLEDTTVRLVKAGAALTFSLTPDTPIANVELSGGILSADKINAVYLSGGTVAQGASGYDQTVTVYAQRIDITIANNTAYPFHIYKVIIKAAPWLALPGDTVEIDQTAPGGTPIPRQVSESPLIQTRSHAEQLTAMAMAFYGTLHPIVEISGCPFCPDRQLGDIVTLSDAVASGWNGDYVIIGRRWESFETVAYRLALLGDAPRATAFFLVGSTNYNGQAKYVAW